MNRTIVITREQEKAFKGLRRDAGKIPLGDSEERMVKWIMQHHGKWVKDYKPLNGVDKKCLIRMALGEDYEVNSRVGQILKGLLNQYDMTGRREKDMMVEYAIKELESAGLLVPEVSPTETKED